MGSVRTVTMVMGSAIALRVSTAPRVRTVSQDDMESTAPPSVCVTTGSVRMVWQEVASVCVIKVGKELPAL